MVQNNLFPHEVQNGKQPQRAVKITHARQSSTTKGQESAQFLTARQERSQGTNQYARTSPDVGSQPKQHGQVRLFGRIGRYFEVKQTQSGVLRAVFSLATQRSFKDESGNWLTQTVWQRIVAWGDTARSIGELLEKGARVSVEGKFKTHEWTDKENNLRTTTELVAHNVRFLDIAEA
jgi:single-strand DNA-binding protein